MWASDSARAGKFYPSAITSGTITHPDPEHPEVEKLSLYVFMEKFRNGAHPYLKITIRNDRPQEIGIRIFQQQDSAPMERCALTATMGNYEKLRSLTNFLKKIADMSLERFSLQGKVAVVTGAGRGLGQEIARTLRAAGAEVIVAEINAENGQAVAEDIGGVFVPLDVTDLVSVQDMVSTVVEEQGRIDILVNNAGVVQNIPSEEVSDEDWRSVVAVNLEGVFRCCREAGQVMLEQGAGAIVNIASMSGIVSNHPQPQASYNASKAGVITLTKSLAGEWAQRGVRVNAVSPGYVGTEMTKRGMSNEAWREAWIAATPMGRVAEPSEIAPAVVYLASEAASFATGTNLVIDGGYTSW